MRGELLADILLILLISTVLFVILSYVNRAKKSPPKSKDDTADK